MNDRAATSEPLIEPAPNEAAESAPADGAARAEPAPPDKPPDAPPATLEDRVRHLEFVEQPA